MPGIDAAQAATAFPSAQALDHRVAAVARLRHGEPLAAVQLLGEVPPLDGQADPREPLGARVLAQPLQQGPAHAVGAPDRADPDDELGHARADVAEPGMQLAFCRRDVDAARRDLVRICAEIREELEPEELTAEAALALGRRVEVAGAAAPVPGAARIAGAVYVSCAGRGGPYFGAPSAEMAVVRHALGDVPLVGFFAGGEIAREHLYGYTGVLTVFSA